MFVCEHVYVCVCVCVSECARVGACVCACLRFSLLACLTSLRTHL